jgi:hypothetical protein
MKENTPVIIYNPNNLLFKHEVWVNDESEYSVGITGQKVKVKATRFLGFSVSKKRAEKIVQKYYDSVEYNKSLKLLQGETNV